MLFLIAINYIQDHLVPSFPSLTSFIPYWETIKQSLENINVPSKQNQPYADFILIYLPNIYSFTIVNCAIIADANRLTPEECTSLTELAALSLESLKNLYKSL
jgi:hypothetical protein